MRNSIISIFRRAVPACVLASLIFATVISNTRNHVSSSLPQDESAINPQPDIASLVADKSNGLADAIREARYSVDEKNGRVYAANPQNKMHAVFENAGDLRLRSSDQNQSWQSEWNLKSIGHGSAQREVIKGGWSGDKTKIVARHRIESPDATVEVEESFENRPDGLEQVFVVDKDPRAHDTAADLRLVLEVDGDLKAHASVDGKTIDLIDESGAKVMQYEKLKVWDANFRELKSRMVTSRSGEVWLEVEDQNAVYPVTVDPSFVRTQQLIRADSAAGDHFGTALGFARGLPNHIAIGAPDAAVGGNAGQGAVYIFRYISSSQTWIFNQKVTASDGAAGDAFGSAIAGFTYGFWIGAPNDNISLNIDQGSVYRFNFNEATGTWSEGLKVLATDGADGDTFGSSISVDDYEDIFVGAHNDDVNGNADQGSVYWINGDTGGHFRRINSSDGQPGDQFGFSISAVGSIDYGLWLASGARRDDNGSSNDEGSVYIHRYDVGSNAWNQTQKLLAPDGELGDNFGTCVVATNSFIYIGATGDDVSGDSGEGSVSYYRNVSETFVFDQKITARDGGAFDRFGSSIAITNDSNTRVIIGSPFADIGNNDNQGAIYFFTRTTTNGSTTFRQTSKRTALDGAANDHFGAAILRPYFEFVIVGSPDDDVSGDVDQGSVSVLKASNITADFDGDFITDLSIFRPSNGQWWNLESRLGAVRALEFGVSTDRITPGDFTGDGKTDVALFRPSTASWFVMRSEDNTFYSFPFGLSTDVPVVGDFDGDSKADPTVFRPGNGTWYILLSSSNGSTLIRPFGSNGDTPVAGDYDDDGRSDVAIFRPGNGQWWVQRSADMSTIVYAFGSSTDKPVPADYTGDGKTDVALFRPSNGFWYVLRSENLSFYSAPFGFSTDLPVPGDYDFDGRTDIAVFRPSEGRWYLNRSSAGVVSAQFGSPGDRPVPNAFVP